MDVTGTNHRSIAHAVAMFERARKNVCDDFHIAVRVRGESLARLHAVFVDDTQAAKMHMRRIIVPIERERVVGIQPAKVKVATLFRFANRDHDIAWG